MVKDFEKENKLDLDTKIIMYNLVVKQLANYVYSENISGLKGAYRTLGDLLIKENVLLTVKLAEEYEVS